MKCTFFGTDGVRARVGSTPFNRLQLSQFAQALAQWARAKYGTRARILIAQDTRTSCDWINTTVSSALLLHNIQVYNARVLPTPAVGALLHYTDQFDCGIIISASHNPHTDNGIKIVDAKNGKLTTADEHEIEQLFNQNIQMPINYLHLGTHHQFIDAEQQYRTLVQRHFKTNFLNGITMILDCAHGATCATAPTLFKSFGATVITINNKPNGSNINHDCGALHPKQLAEQVRKHNAHIGFAFDGDGDRVVAVNKDSIIKNGDDILALLSTHPLYERQKIIVGTIMSNQGFASFLEQNNKTLIRTPVGDKYVSTALKQHNALLGGEQSGHIIMRDYLPTGDGMVTALRIAETMIINNNWSFETFIRFPQILINVPVGYKHNLETEPFSQLIAQHKRHLENGRLVVRYSGTESVLRVMVEDVNAKHAQDVGSALAHILQKELS